MPTCNGHQVKTGCYIDGHWGQYGPDRMADIAEGFGWVPDKITDDPRILREFATSMEDAGRTDYLVWEWYHETPDEIEQWLNEHTGPECPECGRAMHPTSDGFYRHTDYPTVGMAEQIGCHAATDTVVHYVWHWHEGEFFLSPVCGEDTDDCHIEDCVHSFY